MNRTIAANLVDVFHLTIPEIYNLTDFQIRHILFHPRKKTGELEEIEIPVKKVKEEVEENIPKKSMRNPRYKEYFESYTALFNFRTHELITEENYRTELKKLQGKFGDLFDDEPKKKIEHKEVEENYKEQYDRLYRCHMGGVLSKKQFEEAVKNLKSL